MSALIFESGISNQQMAIRIAAEDIAKYQSLTFEYSESQFKNFRTNDGKMFAKTYKSCKRKIAQLFKVDMTNASQYSCKFMESLQSAKHGFPLLLKTYY